MNELSRKPQGDLQKVDGQDRLRNLLKIVDTLPYYVGAKPFDDEEETMQSLIANFIMKRYKLTNNEVVDAFEMAAAGELYLDNKRVSLNTYGSTLDIEKVGIVLTAYRNQKNRQKIQPKRIEHKESKVETPSAKWHYDSMMEEVRKTGKMPKFRAFATIEQYMIEQGMLSEKKVVREKYRSNRIKSIAEAVNSCDHRQRIASYLRSKGIIN